MTKTANDNDPRVTQTYRDLATEKAPAALDDKVLAMAAAAARTPYGLARAWMRPVAWAATIGLCLAIVVEVARFNGEPPAQADFDAGRVAGEPTAPQGALPAASDMPASPPEEAKMHKEGLEKSDAPRRQRVSTPQPAAPESDSLAEEFAAKRELAPTCNDEQRASPENWYKCAEALREMGLDDAADLELEALRSAFPDFPMTGSRVSN
jgi:hypothetical protein